MDRDNYFDSYYYRRHIIILNNKTNKKGRKMIFKHKRTYIILGFMLVFIVSGIVSFIQSTNMNFDYLSLVQKIFAACLIVFVGWMLCMAIYGALSISEE